jgi:hypothetical protein
MQTVTYQHTALTFGWCIVRKEWEAARNLLCSVLRSSTTARSLEEEVSDMIEYTEDVLTRAEIITDMEDWPNKEEDDIGWAYVALSGDSFSEAATVIIKLEDGRMVIRSIEWGRP